MIADTVSTPSGTVHEFEPAVTESGVEKVKRQSPATNE
jgi:hypothetical protein